MPMSNGLFPRNFKKTFPIASRGEGCWIGAADGRRFLDASGQAAVVSIGHGVAEIGQGMAEQSSQIAFAHTSQFHTAPAERLAGRLLAMAPANFRSGGRVYFTSGGSEATETAIKLARQFHLERGQKDRVRVLSRRQSYHGSSLGAMSLSRNGARRRDVGDRGGHDCGGEGNRRGLRAFGRGARFGARGRGVRTRLRRVHARFHLSGASGVYRRRQRGPRLSGSSQTF